MVSGADILETETETGGGKTWADTSSSSGHSGSNMDMEDQVDNAGEMANHHQTEQAVNGNASNGNIDHNTDNMDVDAAGPRANSILANPSRFECLIRYGG